MKGKSVRLNANCPGRLSADGGPIPCILSSLLVLLPRKSDSATFGSTLKELSGNGELSIAIGNDKSETSNASSPKYCFTKEADSGSSSSISGVGGRMGGNAAGSASSKIEFNMLEVSVKQLSDCLSDEARDVTGVTSSDTS